MKQAFLNLTLLMFLTMAPVSAWANNCQQAERLFKQSQRASSTNQQIQLLTEATRLCPAVVGLADAHYALAQLKEKSGDLANAQQLYQNIINSDPNYARAYAGLGEILMKRKDYNQAAKVFDNYLNLADQNPALQSQIEKYEKRLEAAHDMIIASFSAEDMYDNLIVGRSVGPQAVVFEHDIPVRFKSNSANISRGDPAWKQCQKIADKLTEVFKQHNSPIRIEGHTDNRGSARYNEILSEKRAESVRKVLITNFQVPAHLLQTIGMGEYHPISNNRTRNGRFLNRRVKLVRIRR